MKNVMIYNKIDDKPRWSNEELFNSFKAQIDNSLDRGWKKDDIIIGTNFDFEYRGIKNKLLTDVCKENPFCNKFYGMLELMKNDILDDDFWFHDQDAWQLHDDLNFPEFDGEIGGCTYIFTPEWNTCSLFIKKSAINILEYIVEFMKMNLSYLEKVQSDENIIATLRHNRTEISDYLSTINTQYNVGRTKMEHRYKVADKPVFVGGFVPSIPDSVQVFNGEDNEMKVNLIDKKLDRVFRKHFKEYKENF
tara:strand:+ start:3552 stop:4298 length:747 start_codon:yes stop_codon:yes gene_type:complete